MGLIYEPDSLIERRMEYERKRREEERLGALVLQGAMRGIPPSATALVGRHGRAHPLAGPTWHLAVERCLQVLDDYTGNVLDRGNPDRHLRDVAGAQRRTRLGPLPICMCKRITIGPVQLLTYLCKRLSGGR